VPLAFKVVEVLGTRTADTILASAHMRARQQAGHMSASDLINILHTALQGGGRSLIALHSSTDFLYRSHHGVMVLSAVGISAATSCPKHRHYKVHNGLERCSSQRLPA
jgi:hypothetical protein